MKLETLTIEQCEMARRWRNECLEALRTPYPLTEGMQVDFYGDVICNRNSPHRYWAIMDDKKPFNAVFDRFVGMVGLTFIEWENRLGRISLIIDPQQRNKGLGEKAVDLVLDKAFNYLNLKTICGECYGCNPAKDFWGKVVAKYGNRTTVLPNRKYWNGKYYDSLHFSIDKEDFNATQ